MVCGTASDVGKTFVVTGLCRALARGGAAVAPFKGQTMSLNSMVTATGAEIARAQYTQAQAAGVEPEAAMNPVLLKPNDDGTSRVVVMGQEWHTFGAAEFDAVRGSLAGTVVAALDDLRRRFDLVLCEGAGSPTELDVLEDDLVNLGLARRVGVPAVLLGDIERGSLFVHLQGIIERLPADLRSCIRGFVINQFRGDPELLDDAITMLGELAGLPTFGILPHLIGVNLDAEGSMNLVNYDDGWGDGPFDTGGDALDVAVVRLPHMSNVTDFDPLHLEPAVRLRFIEKPAEVAYADLVVLPGTRATVGDLDWLRRQGLAQALEARRRSPSPPVLLGIGGGFEMLGATIGDPGGIEGPAGTVPGLGWLDVATEFLDQRIAARRSGFDPAGQPVTGFEIHHGSLRPGDAVVPLFTFGEGGASAGEGARDDRSGVYGTSLHGMFESDGARADFLHIVSLRRGKSWQPSKLAFMEEREAQIDRLADACEGHLDLAALSAVAAGAG